MNKLVRFTDFQIEPEVISSDECSATVSFFPLERGLGNTIGNTLRRLLLSSIPSAAVFAIRIAGLPHEFSPIKGIAEDVTQLIIAIKKLVLKVDEKLFDCEEWRNSPIENWPFLKVRKNTTGVVFAKDIQCFPGVEIVNPELRLCEVTVEGASFELDLFCTVDRGYRSSKDNRELLSTLSLIPIDSLFSPVLLVDWKVSEEKTTKHGLKDRLKLSVSTNGSIKALDAIWYSSKILISIFEKIAEKEVNLYKIDSIPKESPELAAAKGVGMEVRKSSIASSPIEILELGQRTYNILKNGGINTISELIGYSLSELSQIRNLGKKAQAEIKEKLEEAGYKFREETGNKSGVSASSS